MNATFESELSARAKREGWKLAHEPSRLVRWAWRGLKAFGYTLLAVLFVGMFFVVIPSVYFASLMIPAGLMNKRFEEIDFKTALPPDVALGLQAAMVGVIAWMTSTSGFRLFIPDKALAVLPFYPVADRDLKKGVKRPWFLWLAYGAVIWIAPITLLAWRLGLNGWQVAGLLALGVIQVGHLAALIVALARWAPIERRQWLEAVMSIVACFSLFGPVLLAIYPGHATPPFVVQALFASPFGWVNAAMNYGVIEGRLAGWLFLAPAVLLWGYAIAILKRGFAIRELRIAATGGVTPIFEYGFRPAKERRKQVAESQAASQLTESPAFAAPDWSGGWFVERWIGKRLSPREKSLLEIVYGGRPRWTRALAIEAATALLFGSVGVYIQAIGGGAAFKETAVGVFTLPLLAAIFLAELLAGARGVGSFRTPTPIYPCGLRETLLAHRKPFLYRIALVAPLFGILASIEHWHRESIGWRVFTAFVLAATLLIAYAPLVARLSFTSLENHFRSFWWFLLFLTAMMLLMVLGLLPLMSEDWQVALPLAVALVACTRCICRWIDRQYAHGELDFSLRSPPVRSSLRSTR